jgi:hypothetical protein
LQVPAALGCELFVRSISTQALSCDFGDFAFCLTTQNDCDAGYAHNGHCFTDPEAEHLRDQSGKARPDEETARLRQEAGYWNPCIITGDDGKATVTFTVPDRSTAWKLAAKAITVQTLAGEATGDVAVSGFDFPTAKWFHTHPT